jgi:hypothetical protein
MNWHRDIEHKNREKPLKTHSDRINAHKFSKQDKMKHQQVQWDIERMLVFINSL